MAGISSIAGLSSLSEDLYYQYLINNNSTSTMLNALSGSSSQESDSGNLLGAVTSGLTSGGLASLNDLTSLAGAGNVLGDGQNLLEASQGLSSFSNLLQTYMNAQQTEAAKMTEKLSEVLEEADRSEETSSLTYQTVQEIYQYFLEKTASSAQAGLVQDTASVTAPSRKALSQGISAERMAWNAENEFDFDKVENELQKEMEGAFLYGVS